MAKGLLEAWNAPSLVSSTTVDLSATPKIVKVENAIVSNLTKDKTELRWTETEQALPLPFPLSQLDPVLGLTVKLSDIVTMLD